MRPLPRLRRALRTVLVTGVAAATASVALTALTSTSAHADNRVTPGNFTGYGFDQCMTPTQSMMNAWTRNSPFSAVGVYISGDSRACRNQPNLTPAWISTQMAKGWRILPITLGPQASCQPRFPRYKDDFKISSRSASNYRKARKQGRAEATKAVAAAKRLGIVERSTLWYDLEGFDLNNTACRESALRFLHGWTVGMHKANYVSGVYSSAGSGIKMLDDVRIHRPGLIRLPDAIWIARWDGKANTSTDYISEAGWQPHKRVKQYLGGHNETWGGVTINIDRNWMSLGNGSGQRRRSVQCGDVNMDLPGYSRVTPSASVALIKALQCNLKVRDRLTGPANGKFDARTVAAVNTFQRQTGTKVQNAFNKRQWTMLFSQGNARPLKRGLVGARVRHVQRALTAGTGLRISVTGVFDQRTEYATRVWQKKVGLSQTGVINPATWRHLKNGR